MKKIALSVEDSLLLAKRSTIETVFGILKGSFQIDHSRHRSKTNFLVNLIAGLIAYTFREQKILGSAEKLSLFHGV